MLQPEFRGCYGRLVTRTWILLIRSGQRVIAQSAASNVGGHRSPFELRKNGRCAPDLHTTTTRPISSAASANSPTPRPAENRRPSGQSQYAFEQPLGVVLGASVIYLRRRMCLTLVRSGTSAERLRNQHTDVAVRVTVMRRLLCGVSIRQRERVHPLATPGSAPVAECGSIQDAVSSA